jgi:hypothetical protein
VLLVIERIPVPPDRGELFEEVRQRHDCSRRDRPQWMQAGYLLHFFTTQVTDQRLANCGSLWRHTSSIPDIHLDKARRLNPFDVHSVTVIEDGKVRSEARGLNELSQVWQREFPQRHALHRLSTQTQNADAECVLARFGITSHVSTSNEGPQKITR